MSTQIIRIGIADDHLLFARSVALMLEAFQGYEVCLVAIHGEDLIRQLEQGAPVPDLMLIDVNMPVMDGIATAQWLATHHPSVKTVALSMNHDDKSVLGMIRAGCCAYLLKDTHPNEFEKALQEVVQKGFYNGDSININFRRILSMQQNETALVLTDREKGFLQHVCTDLTYRQIADVMHLSERTIDGYREALFHKFNVQSRVGLALEAIRKGFVELG